MFCYELNLVSLKIHGSKVSFYRNIFLSQYLFIAISFYRNIVSRVNKEHVHLNMNVHVVILRFVP